MLMYSFKRGWRMNDKTDQLITYSIGTGGVTWGSFVALSHEITTVIGLLTAIGGLVLVCWRIYHDIIRGRRSADNES